MTKILCGECIHNSDKGGGCLIPKNLGYVDNCNHYLPKDRPIVQTNEEWLRSATFEELAGAIYEWYSQGHIEGKFGKQLSSATRVVEWLKQPHTNN